MVVWYPAPRRLPKAIVKPDIVGPSSRYALRVRCVRDFARFAIGASIWHVDINSPAHEARFLVNAIGNVGMETRRSSFEFEQLLSCGRGELFAEGPQLPLPPMLMFDRISEIADTGGPHGKGLVRAELDVKPDLWFFSCHFKGDPVMPGCLGLDALWQLVGFFLGWLGAPGRGRALGLGELKFSGQVLPTVKKIVYGIDIKRVMRTKLVLGIADGWLSADGAIIYRASDLKVGLFREEAAVPAGGT